MTGNNMMKTITIMKKTAARFLYSCLALMALALPVHAADSYFEWVGTAGGGDGGIHVLGPRFGDGGQNRRSTPMTTPWMRIRSSANSSRRRSTALSPRS